MVDKTNYSFGIIAMVAIVAIVGIIVLFMGQGATATYVTQPEVQQAMPIEEENIVGGAWTSGVRCWDNDGGKNYYVRGKGTGLYGYEKQRGIIFGEDPNKVSIRYNTRINYSIYYDHCFDSKNSKQLNEAYCGKDGLLFSFGYQCPNGCANGACIRQEIERPESPSRVRQI